MNATRRTTIVVVAMLAIAAVTAVLPALADTTATYTFSGKVASGRGDKVDKKAMDLDSPASIDLELAWTSLDADLDVSLIDPSGTTVSKTKGNASPKGLTFKAPTGGTWTLAVSARKGASTYTLTADVTEVTPSPSPSPTPSPTPSPSPSPTPSPSPSPSPTPSPTPSTCSGVVVPAGSDLKTVMAAQPAGTTFCLAAGTFRVASSIKTEVGDRVMGAGRDATLIDGTGLPKTASGIFSTNSGNVFANLDIFGAPTPAAGSGVFCSPNPNCGKAFAIGGSSLTLRSVDCHDNGGNCIGGGGSHNVTVDDLDCWGNGNAYSMTSSFRYAACIKRAAAYTPGNNTTVTNSYIHDNAWVGLWCDYCKFGLFDIENNRIIHNGSNGIQWEMSGGWTGDDRATIVNNVIRANNYLEAASFRGGIGISSANDILVGTNGFGTNFVAGVNIIYAASRTPPQPDSRGVIVQNNTMNGDRALGCSVSGVSCTANA